MAYFKVIGYCYILDVRRTSNVKYSCVYWRRSCLFGWLWHWRFPDGRHMIVVIVRQTDKNWGASFCEGWPAKPIRPFENIEIQYQAGERVPFKNLFDLGQSDSIPYYNLSCRISAVKLSALNSPLQRLRETDGVDYYLCLDSFLGHVILPSALTWKCDITCYMVDML